jgi:hypothetical protein
LLDGLVRVVVPHFQGVIAMKSYVSAAAVLAWAACSCPAQTTITALIREGDMLPGGAVALVNQAAANDIGGYIVDMTVGGVDAFWGSAAGGPGSVLRSEGVFPPYTQTGFEGFFGFGDAGQIAYSPTCTGTFIGSGDTAWLDSTPFAVEAEPHPTLANQWYRFASRPTVATSTGELWWYGALTSTRGGSSQTYGLFRGMQGTPVLLGGQSVPGVPFNMTLTSSAQIDYQISGNGSHWISTLTIQSGQTANDTCVVKDGAGLEVGGALVREGSPVPVSAGGDGAENWQNFGVYGVNNAGSYMIAGDTSAATTVDHFLLKDGQIILREGAIVGGFPLTGAQTGLDLNESGDWAAIWNVTANGGTRECIIVNGDLIVKETDPIDFDGDGQPDPGVTLVDISASEVALGERVNGFLDVYFTGDTSSTANVGEAAYRIRIPLGSSCPGNACGDSDFNGDGDFGTDQDIEAFFACLAGNCCATCFCQGSDFNGDGDFGTDADIEAFFRVLAGGGC